MDFHVEKLNYLLTNAGNQLLINTDGLRQELDFNTELLKEEFDLPKKHDSKRIDLTHVLTISSLDPDNENTYKYTNDPKNATLHFTRLLKIYFLRSCLINDS